MHLHIHEAIIYLCFERTFNPELSLFPFIKIRELLKFFFICNFFPIIHSFKCLVNRACFNFFLLKALVVVRSVLSVYLSLCGILLVDEPEGWPRALVSRFLTLSTSSSENISYTWVKLTSFITCCMKARASFMTNPHVHELCHVY